MKKFLLLILVIVCANIYTNAQTWPQYYGSAGIETSTKSVAIYTGVSGNWYDNILMVGSTTSFGSGAQDGYLIKTDMSGYQISDTTFGDVNDDLINSICAFNNWSVSQETYIIGGYTNNGIDKDIFIAEIDTSGNLYQAISFFPNSNGDDELKSVKSLNMGNFYGAGYTTTQLGDKNFYLMKFEEWYNPIDTIYTFNYGGNGDDIATCLYGDGFNPIWIAGYSNSFGGGDNDIFIVNYDENQTMSMWQKTYGGTGEDIANDIVVTFGGFYFIVGSTTSFGAGGKDIYLLKLDFNGDTVWSKTYGGSLDEEGLSLTVQSGEFDNILISGYSTSFGSGDKDAYLLKINTNGDTLWTKVFGQSGIDDIATTVIYNNCEWFVSGTSGDQMFLHKFSEPKIPLTFTTTDVSCYGGNDGYVFLEIPLAYEQGMMSYLWSNGGAQALNNGNNQELTTRSSENTMLTAGWYTVSVNDGFCITIDSVEIFEPTPLTSTHMQLTKGCYLASDKSAVVTPSGGTPPYSYDWFNMGIYDSIAYNLPAFSQDVFIYDNNGCSYHDTVPILDSPSPLNIIYSAQYDMSCPGVCDGSAKVTASGGSFDDGFGYNYYWLNAVGQNTDSISNLCTNAYHVTIIDSYECSVTLDSILYVNEPSPTYIDFGSYNTSCNGSNDGMIKLYFINGIAPFTFNWSNGSTNDTLTALTPGTYSVTVTNAIGCVVDSSYIISEPTAIADNAVINNISCSGANDGSIKVIPSGGVAPYYYFVWTDNSNNDSIANLSAGDYSVTISDITSCSKVFNYTISEPLSLTSTVSTSNIACYGDNTGSATVTHTGGTSPYTYLWSNGFNGANYNNFVAGTYTVTVTDANNCTANNFVNINQPTFALTSTITSTNILCNGASTGAVDLTVIGGTISYSFLWSNGSVTEDLTNLTAGTYQVTILDANSCQTTNNIIITEPTSIVLTTSSTNSTCGNANGTATINIISGISPFTIDWNGTPTGDGTTVISNLTSGSYDVTVTDANACSAATSVIVNDITGPTLSVGSISHVNCFNSSNGSATIIASGGTTPFNYLWSNGNTTNSISSVSGGTYSMTATDANICTATISVTINEPASALSTSIIPTDASCFGSSDASADLTVTGGTTPYSFIWNNTANTEDLSSLSIGTYIVTVTDNNGCNATNSVIISQPSQIFATISKTNISCFNLTDGSLTVSVNGGTSPYTYLWSNSVTTSSINNLSAAVYDITITDSNGCSIFRNDTITEPSAIVINFSSIQNSCAGANNGSLTASVTGGNQPYSYLWSTSSTTQSINNLAAGNYDVTVTDANGCVASMTNFITQSPLINLTINGPSTTLCPGTSVTLTAQPTGGMPPFTFNWTDGYTTPAITVTPTTTSTYSVYVIDANGCSSSPQSKIVNIFTVPLVIINASSTTICVGESVQIIAAVSGGNAPYTYTWDDIGLASNIRTVNPTLSTTYILSVTDNCSQQISDNVAITVNPLPTISGIAQYTGGTMTQGKVMAKLFSTVSIYDYNGFLSVDSAINGSDNKFYINNVELGEYILKVTPTDNTYPTVLPTYYDTVLLSEYAVRLNVECGIDQDLTVVMKELQPASAGIYTISGKVTLATNNKDVLGEPIPGAEITLEQEPDDEPIANTQTGSGGDYIFTDLVAAQYSIVVDIPGLPQFETHTILVDSDTTNINYVVDITDSVGIFIDYAPFINRYELNNFSVNLYPVPFDNKLNIDFSLDIDSEVSIELIDITGKNIEKLMSKKLSKGSYNNIYQLENIINGIYLVKMQVGNSVLLKKIIKD